MVEGYNIALKVGNKTLAGRTQDDLSITPTTKESITKDDAGNKESRVVGHEVTFSCQGLVDVTSSSTTKMNRDDIIALALATGNAAEVTVVYTCEGGDTYTGSAVCTGYSESSNSEDEATYTVDFKISGAFTATT
jgi:hypothetical protein